jgi:hypothetical protein
MLLCKHLEHLFASVAAESVGVVRGGEGESSLVKRKATEITELWGGAHLLSRAEGLDIGDDAPTVQGIDGGCKGRLSAVRNAIAYFFEKGAL